MYTTTWQLRGLYRYVLYHLATACVEIHADLPLYINTETSAMWKPCVRGGVCQEKRKWTKIGYMDESTTTMHRIHDDVIKWKHFPRYWPFVRGIYRSPLNSPHKVQWRGALMFSLIYAWTNSYVNNGDDGGLRRHRAHYVVTIMVWWGMSPF